jgi:hypothetical protein
MKNIDILGKNDYFQILEYIFPFATKSLKHQISQKVIQFISWNFVILCFCHIVINGRKENKF